ncbi:MAG: hypothetical protein J6O18_05075 [Bacilli bacterium]|nr:hypothetical protein [Bacilli bacterium]
MFKGMKEWFKEYKDVIIGWGVIGVAGYIGYKVGQTHPRNGDILIMNASELYKEIRA